MEIELKYLIEDKMKADGIWNELKDRPDTMMGSAEEKLMHAVYFDAEDECLSKEKIAVRVRREGDEMVATVKWGGNHREALNGGEAVHARPELNVPVRDESWFWAPPAELFGDSDIGKRIVELLGEEPLVPLLETKFTRRLVQIRCENPENGEAMLCEAAVDTGEIVAGDRSEPICELELELLTGENGPLMILGEELKARYGLVAGTKSKFARGKALRVEK